MLLNVLILIGAILAPTEYVWLYSTHIVLVCLYLIYTHSFFSLFLTFVSLIVLFMSEWGTPAHLSLNKGQVLQFDPGLKQLHVERAHYTQALEHKQFIVQLMDKNGLRREYLGVVIRPIQSPLNGVYPVTLGKIITADKTGNWQARRLYRQRCAALLQVDLSAALNIPDHKTGSIRDTINERLNAGFAEFASWRFSKGLLLGNNDLWDDRDKWVIRALGLAHLFVVSGLHTGFVFVFGQLLSRLLWRLLPNSWVLSGINCWSLDALVTMPVLFGYAYLTDWGAPVVRAAIMLSCYLLAKVFFTHISAYRVVLFALWGILLVDPRDVLQPGLWLSFSLVCFLIAFSQGAKHWTRLLPLQLMLSTASMVLIWGWQEAISLMSIPVNIVMIPIAAMVWFPWTLLASVEFLVFDTHYLYLVLDGLLLYLIAGIEWLAFHLPMFAFDRYLRLPSKFLLLCLVVFWVWQAPLRRGWACVFLIWCVLLLPREGRLGAQYQLINNHDELLLKQNGEVMLSNKWFKQELTGRFLSLPMGESASTQLTILLPVKVAELKVSSLLAHSVDWVILTREPSKGVQSMLAGLSIGWLTVHPGEKLMLRQSAGVVSVRHLACTFSVFLVKSDTCKRVETLEFMLN